MPDHLHPFQLPRTDTFGDDTLPRYHSSPRYSAHPIRDPLAELQHREAEERHRRSIFAGLQAEEDEILEGREQELVKRVNSIVQEARSNGDNQEVLKAWRAELLRTLEAESGWNLIDEQNWKQIRKVLISIKEFVHDQAPIVNEHNEIDGPYTVESIVQELDLRNVVTVHKQLLHQKLRSIVQEADNNGERPILNLDTWANELTQSLETDPRDPDRNYRDRFRWYKIETALAKVLVAITNREKTLLEHPSGRFNPELSPHSLIHQMYLEPVPRYEASRPRSDSPPGSLRPPPASSHHRAHSQSSLSKFQPVARQVFTSGTRY